MLETEPITLLVSTGCGHWACFRRRWLSAAVPLQAGGPWPRITLLLCASVLFRLHPGSFHLPTPPPACWPHAVMFLETLDSLFPCPLQFWGRFVSVRLCGAGAEPGSLGFRAELIIKQEGSRTFSRRQDAHFHRCLARRLPPWCCGCGQQLEGFLLVLIKPFHGFSGSGELAALAGQPVFITSGPFGPKQ